jgi:Reverse transcriptase (RNA-dependent DNA polymerase)
MGIPPIPPHCRVAAEQVPAFDERGVEISYVPQLPPQPQEEPSGLQPRCSNCERRPVVRPDNVYRSWNPTQSEQMSNREFREIIDDVSAPSGSGNRPDSPPHEGKGKKRADYLVKMVQEGGASLIKFLLSAAVSSAPAKEKIPEVSKVREWHYRDLMRLPKAMQEEWKIACKEEPEALRRCNVFKLTNLPKGRKTIGCRWVFNVKSDSCKKARLVAQGFSQVEGINFNKLFSPVVRFESVQLILALSALEDYYCVGVDVHNAYLYGKLDEEIYMRQPEGFKARGQENKVIHLQCALYGLKKAGLAWWKELNSSMNELGFKCLVSDAGLFVCKDYKEIIIAIVYVDHAMLGSSRLQEETLHGQMGML